MEENIDQLIELIGGYPDKIILFINKLSKYRDLGKALNLLIRSLVDDVYTKLNGVRREYGGKYSSLRELLAGLTESPLEVTELFHYHGDLIDLVDVFVKCNVLQYGNSEYLGIYRWNKEVSGGEGGLDVLAPSSRLYLYSLCELTSSDSDVCKRLREIVKSIG